MIESVLAGRREGPLRVLALGAHCDDIEIGCGGTILELLARRRGVEVDWLVLASNETRAREARGCAARFLEGAAEARVRIESFRDGYLPWHGAKVKDCFERLKGEVRPDLIFTHAREDWHQDHRLVCELTWNTFRDHLILEYEVPKYDPDTGSPNAFVHLSESSVRSKVALLMEGYPSQATKHWFDEKSFLGLMRLRGMQSVSQSGYAEAFWARKIILG